MDASSLVLPSTRYIPHRPTPKQLAFLWLPHREAFYGGAAGGGKSDALLMAALQYVHVPGYHALVIRKTLEDAKKPGSIMFRAREWLARTNAVWVASEHAYYFPTDGAPAVLKFGKLANIGDAYNYQGSDYQFIGFDELTQFYQTDVEYVITRLRRPRCPYHDLKSGHMDSKCPSCREFGPLYGVPLRVRTASNPGGMGHLWVKRRYLISRSDTLVSPQGKPLYAGQNPKRPHIPAYIQDNPFLDQESYIETLSDIEDPVTREQLLAGDWGISEDGRFKSSWAMRYNERYGYFELGNRTFHQGELENFIIADTAASKAATPGKTQLTKKLASFSAAMVCSKTPNNHLIIRRVMRHQDEVHATRNMLGALLNEYRPCQFVGMEFTTMSTHLYQMLVSEGFNMRPFSPHGGDKIARSVTVSNMLEQGRVWFPSTPSTWLDELEEELWTWTGNPLEVDDQVDCLSYAGIYLADRSPRSDRREGQGMGAIPVAVVG